MAPFPSVCLCRFEQTKMFWIRFDYMNSTKWPEFFNSAFLVKYRSLKRKYAEKEGFHAKMCFVDTPQIRGGELSNLGHEVLLI